MRKTAEALSTDELLGLIAHHAATITQLTVHQRNGMGAAVYPETMVELGARISELANLVKKNIELEKVGA